MILILKYHLHLIKILVVSQTDDDVPTHYFKVTKLGVLQSGETFEEDFTFGNSIKFNKVILSKENVVEITSCIDDDGNKWYRSSILKNTRCCFEDEENTSVNTPDLSQYKDETPYLMKLIKTRRFTTYIRSDGRTEVRFGSGISTSR